MTTANDAFKRWQDHQVNQFTVYTNVITGLATGLLAFVLSTSPENPATPDRFATIASLGFLIVSLGISVYLANNRLASFRLTASSARLRDLIARTTASESGAAKLLLRKVTESASLVGFSPRAATRNAYLDYMAAASDKHRFELDQGFVERDLLPDARALRDKVQGATTKRDARTWRLLTAQSVTFWVGAVFAAATTRFVFSDRAPSSRADPRTNDS